MFATLEDVKAWIGNYGGFMPHTPVEGEIAYLNSALEDVSASLQIVADEEAAFAKACSDVVLHNTTLTNKHSDLVADRKTDQRSFELRAEVDAMRAEVSRSEAKRNNALLNVQKEAKGTAARAELGKALGEANKAVKEAKKLLQKSLSILEEYLNPALEGLLSQPFQYDFQKSGFSSRQLEMQEFSLEATLRGANTPLSLELEEASLRLVATMKKANQLAEELLKAAVAFDAVLPSSVTADKANSLSLKHQAWRCFLAGMQDELVDRFIY